MLNLFDKANQNFYHPEFISGVTVLYIFNLYCNIFSLENVLTKSREEL